jgi:16S rRNA (guanine966-N2)-methyltransferase
LIRSTKGESLSVACVVFCQWEIPDIATVSAPVRHDIAHFPQPVFGWVREKMAGPATVDAHDCLSRFDHRRSLPCVRVVAGDLRGRRIESPVGDATRPTTDKVREAVFNALGSLDIVDGARVLDLFAGTGAMGIEALSRGATHCVFVESDRQALTVLQSNIRALGLGDRSTVVAGDVHSLAENHRCADIVIADPPYGYSTWGQLLETISAPCVVLESDREIGEVAGWNTVRAKKYGRTHVSFLEPDGARDGTVEVE